MRKIKFRAWLTNSDSITYSNGSHMEYDITLVDGKYADVEDGWDIQGIRDYPIMQYTGLKDKNGKEIYEGDILSYFTKVKENGKVQFNSDKGQFEVFWNFGDVNSFDKHWTENELEIIGNIYENPNLLTK